MSLVAHHRGSSFIIGSLNVRLGECPRNGATAEVAE